MNLIKLAAKVAGGAALLVTTAGAQYLPMALTTAWTSRAGGDYLLSSARVGEAVELHVGVWNFSGNSDSVTVDTVSVVIHHGSGPVEIPNLLAGPITLPGFGARAILSTNFVAQPDDPDVLEIAYTVNGSYNDDGGWWFGFPAFFTAEFGCQIQIVKPPAPALSITSHGPGSVRVRWPAAAAGYQLEQRAGLAGDWTAVTNTPVMDHEGFSVAFDASEGSCHFYRLIKP